MQFHPSSWTWLRDYTQRDVRIPGGATVKRTGPRTGPTPRLPDGTVDLDGVWVGGGPVNDLEREYENYTTTVLAHTAANRGHRVCYITPADFVLNADDSLSVHGRFLLKRKYKDRSDFFAALKDSQGVKIEREGGRLTYELRIVGARGRLLKVHVDAATGEIGRIREK